MEYVALEECLDKSGGSIYKLTVMVAKRAQELAGGAKPLVESEGENKPIHLALRELVAGFLRIEQAKGAKK